MRKYLKIKTINAYRIWFKVQRSSLIYYDQLISNYIHTSRFNDQITQVPNSFRKIPHETFQS